MAKILNKQKKSNLFFFSLLNETECECLLCNIIIKYKLTNLQRHHKRKHMNVVQMECNERSFYLEALITSHKNKVHNNINNSKKNRKSASDILSHELALAKKPMTDAYFIQQCCIKILRALKHDKAAAEVALIPLSVDIIRRRVSIISDAILDDSEEKPERKLITQIREEELNIKIEDEEFIETEEPLIDQPIFHTIANTEPDPLDLEEKKFDPMYQQPQDFLHSINLQSDHIRKVQSINNLMLIEKAHNTTIADLKSKIEKKNEEILKIETELYGKIEVMSN